MFGASHSPTTSCFFSGRIQTTLSALSAIVIAVALNSCGNGDPRNGVIISVKDQRMLLVKNGHQVVIEAGAGMGARYSDKDFSEAGAEIRTDKKEIYQ